MRTIGAWLRLWPGVEDPPGRVWRDWFLAAAVAGVAISEVIFSEAMVWPVVAGGLGLMLALAMLWRRTHPLAMIALSFGAFLVVDLASVLTGAGPFSLYAGSSVVVLVYALFRWGTSGQAAIGALMVLAEWSVSAATDFTGVTDTIGGLALLLFAAALGAAVRFRRTVHTQQLDRVRFRERECLARELHDSIAHRVTAIAIQAQAGQVLARTDDLGGASQALKMIEAEASLTLTEMRSIVGSLRKDNDTAHSLLTPDLSDLMRTHAPSGLRVEVQQCGDLDDLRPSVQMALYRVAQESITNAQRHARNATRVHVLVDAGTDTVRIRIDDDGEHTPHSTPNGYGLVGMRERVSLVGGTFQAGPGPEQGWEVCATIPRRGIPA